VNTAGLTESQRAIYQALAAANICGGRISDNPEDDVEFPHIEIGETIAEQLDLTGYQGGTDETMLLTAWSRERSTMEVKNIVGQVRDTLDGRSFDEFGRSSLHCYVLDETVRREPDAKTHRAVIRVRVIHFGEKES